MKRINAAITAFNKSIDWIEFSVGEIQTSPRFNASTESVAISPSGSMNSHRTSLKSLMILRCACKSSWKRNVKMHSQCHGFPLKYKEWAWWFLSRAFSSKYAVTLNIYRLLLLYDKNMKLNRSLHTFCKRFPLRLKTRNRSSQLSDSSASIVSISL